MDREIREARQKLRAPSTDGSEDDMAAATSTASAAPLLPLPQPGPFEHLFVDLRSVHFQHARFAWIESRSEVDRDDPLISK